jgi:hypothetical protein
MFVGSEVPLDVSFGVACARMATLAHGGWLGGASGDAYREWDTGLARVGPLDSVPGVSRLVEVRFRDLVMHGESATLALRWETAGPGGGLFPVLDADLTLAPVAASATTLRLAGSYRPPLGKVGAMLDRVALRRVAVATIRGFLERVGDAVVNPAGAAGWAEEGEQRRTGGVFGIPVFPPAPETT